jgi:Glycosyl hydrolase catalytic core.
MYKRNPGIKAKFNGVALHPYTGKYQDLTPEIEEFRNVLTANHDPGKGLWITELGWSSQAPTPTNIFAKGMAGQATQLKGAFSLLARNQAKWKLQRVYWFSVDDAAGACNFCGGSGLFAEGFVPKKSWYAYVKFVGGTP